MTSGAIAVLAIVTLAAPSLAGDKKSMVFDSTPETVWNAAVETAKADFQLDKMSREEGWLRFRGGPLGGYRFELVIEYAGVGKTRVDLELRTEIRALGKDAWREGGRYLSLLERRLRRNGRP